MVGPLLPGGAVAHPKHSVSFCPAQHPARTFSMDTQMRLKSNQSPAESFLRSVASTEGPLIKELLHTSFPAGVDISRDIIPQNNGFVHTAIEAYNNHRGLIIRPDDVWLAIMIQFSFFVNGHSEELRKMFVAHEGKCDLTVTLGGNRYTMDPSFMAQCMMSLMEEHITDPSLRAWIVPDFTTTTTLDRTTSAIVMMGMMKNYFTYKCCLLCGIPKVTLEGEKKDWETILHRIEQLKKYGLQTVTWYHLLRPIITRFIAAYDKPDHPDNLNFWNKIAWYEGGGSGLPSLSGWITAFCVFDERGEWHGGWLNVDPLPEHEPLGQLSAPQFMAEYMTPKWKHRPNLELDGIPYPTIDSEDVPCGYVAVDVLLNDNGDIMETMFIAGSVGSQICSTKIGAKSIQDERRDTVRPVTAWWYVVKHEAEGVEKKA